jgi:hypothetical protein
VKILFKFSIFYLFIRLGYLLILKFNKLINYDINQGFERNVFGYPEPYWLCLSAFLFYGLSLILLATFQKYKLSYLIFRVLSIFSILSLILNEYLRFHYEGKIKVDHIVIIASILIIVSANIKPVRTIL